MFGNDDCSETCFNVRYPAKNGRSTGNPWSIRHTTVYHQYDCPKQRHVWVVIQPSNDYRQQILQIMNLPLSEIEASWVIGATCLFSTNQYWREYIVHLQEGVRTLVRNLEMPVYSKLTATGEQSSLLEGWRPSKERLRRILFTFTTASATAQEDHNGYVIT